ncbi:MAG: hypothetical protein P8I94_06730 [Emcibacteraceae bacterium]|nr:hypothetical protein [Emcibacteraceae bacterium]
MKIASQVTNVINPNDNKETPMSNNNRGALRVQSGFAYNQVAKSVVPAVTGTTAPRTMKMGTKSKQSVIEVRTVVKVKDGKEIERDQIFFNNEYALSLTTKEFTRQVTVAYEQLIGLHSADWISTVLENGLIYALKAEARKADNLLSYHVARIIADKDSSKLVQLRLKVEALADAREALYEQYGTHVLVITGLAGRDFDIHPFTRRLEVTYVMDNTIVEDADSLEDEDEADAFIREMEQKDLRVETGRQTANQAKNTDQRSVEQNITRDEWVELMLDRTHAEWLDAGSFGAWSIAKGLVVDFCEDRKNADVLDYLQNYKVKPLSFCLKSRRKALDAQAAVESCQRRIDYLNDLSHSLDSDVTMNTLAAMNGSVNDMEVGELKAQMRELETISDKLFTISEELTKVLSIAKLEDEPIEFVAYETYLTFDPIERIVEQFIKKAEIAGKRAGYEFIKAARKAAYKQMGNPEVVALDPIPQFKDGQAESTGDLHLWAVRYKDVPMVGVKDIAVMKAAIKTGKTMGDYTVELATTLLEQAQRESMLALIRRIRTLRYQEFQRDEFIARKKGIKDIIRMTGMRNKKMSRIMDGADAFTF